MNPVAKPRPKMLDKRAAKADVTRIDREENAKVKYRSTGQCELYEQIDLLGFSSKQGAFVITSKRCRRRASHIHHLISGIGRRNIGASIEAAHKLHLCDKCHSEIHGHVLKPVNATERYDADTIRFERVS